MRYSKLALLVFGAGLLFGFVVVVAELHRWDRLASIAMALGIVALPAAVLLDLRRRRRRPPARSRGKRRPPSRAARPRRSVPRGR